MCYCELEFIEAISLKLMRARKRCRSVAFQRSHINPTSVLSLWKLLYPMTGCEKNKASIYIYFNNTLMPSQNSVVTS